MTPSPRRDRKSTRLKSSHVEISYAVFCLKKKKDIQRAHPLARAVRGDQDLLVRVLQHVEGVEDLLLNDFLAFQELDVVHFFFFNDAAAAEIYTLSLHDALPI